MFRFHGVWYQHHAPGVVVGRRLYSLCALVVDPAPVFAVSLFFSLQIVQNLSYA